MKPLKIIILLVIGVIIGIVLTGMYKFNYLANQPGYDVDGNRISIQEEVIQEDISEGIESEPEESMIIRIPDADLLGESVVFTEYTVPKSAGVLHATYNKLFEVYASENGYNGLFYDSIILDNGVARIFLTGSWFPAGDLSGAYMRNNINEAAFQFDSVQSIEVYLNDNLFDWCIDDQSGGENGCLDTPRYWIDSR